MGTSRVKKKNKQNKKSNDEEEDSIKRSLAELATIFGRSNDNGDDSSTPIDEEDLLQMAVDYLKMATQNEKNTSKRSRSEKSSHRKKRKSKNVKKGSKNVDTGSSSSHSSHGSKDSCWESAFEGYMTGYKDCSKEAVRYLIEEEGLTANNEIVVGLQNHLREAEMNIDNNNHNALVGHSLVSFASPRRTELNNGASQPTQTSPQLLPPIREFMPTSSNTFSTTPSFSNSLPQGTMTALSLSTSNVKVMKPLTVDTNQEYELPSPLMRGAEAAKKSKESLLTIAHTQPTASRAVYTHSMIQQTAIPTTAISCASQRIELEKSMGLNMGTQFVGGQVYGFNLNYAAPYVYAWVKPAQH